MTNTFPTQDMCNNFTQSCHGNGQCTIGSQNTWSCACATLYDSTSFCALNFYQYYRGVDTYYYVLGWLCSFIGLVLLIPEILMDVHLSKHNLPNFTAKIFAMGFFLFSIVDYALWCVHSVTERVTYSDEYYVMFDLSLLSAYSCYTEILLIWINLYTKVINLSEKDTRYFQNAKTGLIIALIIIIVTELTLSILFATGIEPTISELIYDVIACICLLVLMFWSWYHAFLINREFTKNKPNESVGKFLKKNRYLSILNCILGVYVIGLVLYVGLNLRQSVWGHLAMMTILRVLEFICLFLIIHILKTYSFLGTNPVSQWTNIWEGGASTS